MQNVPLSFNRVSDTTIIRPLRTASADESEEGNPKSSDDMDFPSLKSGRGQMVST